MTFIMGSYTLGAALLFSAIKNLTLIQLIKGEPGPGQPESIVDKTINAHQSSPSSSTTPLQPSGPLVPGHYANPLPGQGTTIGRIDQGQDFGGTGTVRAIGNAKITRVGAPGWPGGEHGVEYKLLDGPRKGQCVYVYEGINVTVRAGQRVKTGQVIGTIIPGTSTGIEMGFSDCGGVPTSHGEYTEGKETRGGKAFAQFLKQLGVK